METKKEAKSFYAAGQKEWRQWLKENHDKEQSVWLVYHKKNSGTPSINYSDAVDESLCFGWIDSTRRSLDENTFTQFFCRRKPTSVWSKVNKAKVKLLIDEGLMTPAGLAVIETAKQNGSWTILDEVEEDIVPDDLAKQLAARPGAEDYFMSLSRSARKSMLQWLVLAKREETRQKRIIEIADLAALGQKPKQF